VNLSCKIFGHKWRQGWAGAYGGVFGAVVVNLKICERCGHSEKEISTAMPDLELPQAPEPDRIT
jgi:hypothetical protein